MCIYDGPRRPARAGGPSRRCPPAGDIYIYIYVYMCIHICVYTHIHKYIVISVSLFLSLSLSIYIYIYYNMYTNIHMLSCVYML